MQFVRHIHNIRNEPPKINHIIDASAIRKPFLRLSKGA
jgi:hypothetical protein